MPVRTTDATIAGWTEWLAHIAEPVELAGPARPSEAAQRGQLTLPAPPALELRA